MPLGLVMNPANNTTFRVRLSRQIQSPALVAKVGYRTTTYGELVCKPVPVLQQGGVICYPCMAYSHDINHWPHGHPMSLPGDSGSWILDSQGDLVGLLWGGDGLTRSGITPIEDICRY